MKNPLISLVVLAYNQFERTTLPCLNSLVPWLTDLELEFIVFDNSSPDGSGAKAQAWCAQYPSILFVQSPSNLGYAGGMNTAAHYASGKWLFLVNNDTEFAPYALDALKKVILSAPPNMAMIGPITNAAGNGQRLYDPSKTKEQWLELGAWLNSNPTEMLLPTYRCDFFCIAIRRDAWDQLKGLDTAFGMGYFEDFDFSLRLHEAGYDQAITEDVFIYHQGSATFSLSHEIKELVKRNKRLMSQKHRDIQYMHARQCNLQIRKLYESSYTFTQTDAQKTRIVLRNTGLKKDLPKSPIKKWLWKSQINRFIFNNE